MLRSVYKYFLFIVFTYALEASAQKQKFITTHGSEIVGLNGLPFLIKGTNLGNWLVPEGYMFKFKSATSPKLINEVITQIVGPEAASKFWKNYLESYITEKDIIFLKSIGVNSIRIPFNYRLFTNEDYLGDNNPKRGFALLDRVIDWCKKQGLYVILDMHCAPGGQTGDNIDDGWGFPFLYTSAAAQDQTVAIWKNIAKHYANNPVIMGYDLLNEPVAHYFKTAELNPFIEPFYKRLVREIRTADKNHIIFLGGAQWNTNFKIFGTPFDNKLVYTFHKYGDQPNLGSIQRFIDFRSKYNVPIYAGETGENTDAWVRSFRTLLEQNNIGWHFWPYKKMDSPKNIITFPVPSFYDSVISYAEQPRGSFKEIRQATPTNRQLLQQSLDSLLVNCRFENCVPNYGYIGALGLDTVKAEIVIKSKNRDSIKR